MEHVTEALCLAASALIFALAVSVMLHAGRCTGELFHQPITQGMSGSIMYEESADE